MRIKLIGCDVFARVLYRLAADSPHTVDLEILPMLAHDEPDQLREDLQEAIDRCSKNDVTYDKVVLAYGLCGNAVKDLKCHVPMIIPRVHDCCALYMGSREEFLRVFGDRLSTRWCTSGYHERCGDYWATTFTPSQKPNHNFPDYKQLVEKHGEENAKYVWDMLHPPIESQEAVYIQMNGFEYGNTQEQFTAETIKRDCTVETEMGNMEWFYRLVNGPWDSKDFLELVPGHVVVPVYDMDEVFVGRPESI